jgi:hypothetical protein
MLKSKPEQVEWIAAEWATKLATVNTVLGRLDVLRSLRDPHTGRYVHHGMSMSVGNQAHDILLKSHKETFADWQRMSIADQMRDLKRFLASRAPDESRMNYHTKSRMVLETWTELESYRNFLPLSVSKLERGLFLVNLTGIIAILKNQLANQELMTAGSSGSESPDQ